MDMDDSWEHHVAPLFIGCTQDAEEDQHGDFLHPDQLLVAGQPTTTSATSPPLGSSGGATPLGAVSPGSAGGSGPLGPGGGSGSAPPSVPGGGPPPGGSSCCENGRPIMTDPVSGQTVCSCQYDSARLALSSYPRISTSGVGVYGTPYPSTDQNPYPSIGVDSSAFYSPLSTPYGLKDSTSSAADMSAWTSAAAGLQPTTGYYPYDPTLAAYGYGAGYDLAARRKNATRESTATLKAWLNEHKKNPYPTKGEKIMLAIITKMTLTQVSTWFANARRRLKKENKMTWEPKNKTDDDDDAIVSDGEDKDTKDEIVGSTGLLDGSSGDPKRSQEIRRDDKEALHHVKSEHGLGKECLEDEDDLDEDERKPPGMLMASHHGPLHHPHHHPMLSGLKDELGSKPSPSECGVPIPATKPKIWSLADTAACKTPPPPPPHSHHHQQQPWVMPNCAGGGSGGGPSSGMNSFAIPPSTGMSPSAAAAPYSRYGVIPYGGGHGATAAGFPDVQTDTPPQTPPNMKLPSVAGQLLTGNSGGQNGFQQPQHQQPQSSSVSGQQQYGSSQHHYMANYTRLQQSPHKERTGGVDSSAYHHQASAAMMTSTSGSSEGTAFKPFYKSSQPMGGGYVSPV